MEAKRIVKDELIEKLPSTLPDACLCSRSGLMQCVAPVGSVPDRLRDAAWKVVK